MTRVRTTAGILALCFLTIAGASACQSGNSEKDTESNRTADINCDGSLNSSAISATRKLLGSESFITSTGDGGAASTAKDIVSEYRTHGISGGKEAGLCWIYSSKKDLSDITISFAFSGEVPQSDKVASTFTPYRLGALALTSTQRAVIYMKCSSVKFESDGSRETFVLRGETNNRYEPEGSSFEAQKNNLIVMHSASLALARALRCENNGGLLSEFKMPAKA
ncbi:hypothetical protein [Streptomyces sp. NPDC002520]